MTVDIFTKFESHFELKIIKLQVMFLIVASVQRGPDRKS